MTIFLRIRTALLFISLFSRVTNASQIIPLLQYDMTNNDCHRSAFFNGGILGNDSIMLIRNSNTTTCTPGFGVESKFDINADNSEETMTSNAVFGSNKIGSFLGKLDGDALPFIEENGLTISLWIRPNFAHDHNCSDVDNCNELSSPRSIFTIGWGVFGSKSSPKTELTLCDEAKIDFQLSITETNMFEIMYRTNDQMFEPCQRMKANVTSIMTTDDDIHFLSRPMHIAISLGNFHQEVFINGISLAKKREMFDANLKHWNPSSFLQFFTYPATRYHQRTPWEGQLFHFSLYCGVLNKHQVKSVMSEGLSPSQPVAHSKVARIYEDGMYKDGTLQQIDMPYTFIDDEIGSLLSSLDLPHQPVPNVRHYITRFPMRGHLLHIKDGRTIEPSKNLPVLVSNADRIIFIPRKDEHSEFYGRTYTSFDYCVTTNKIIMSSQCTATTIFVVVDPVNDPPVAFAPPLYVVHEGIQNEARALLLTGSDVDKNDFIQNIQITSTPKMGFLFLSVSSFRKEDNLLHGTALEKVNNTMAGNEVYIEYRFTDYNTTTVQDSLVVDFFRFRVQDSVGSWSSEAEVKIQVLSNVFSSNGDPDIWAVPSLVNKKELRNQLSGIDLSGLNRTLGFLIKSLPSTVEVLGEEDSPLVKNEIIASRNSSFNGKKNFARTDITYVGIQSACNERDIPLINDMLRYQVVALDSEKEVTSISSVKEEEISIFCKVEPVSIRFITEDRSRSLSTFVSPADDSCSGYMFDFSGESKRSCRNTTMVFGLDIDGIEKVLEPVYAVITTSPGGFLSMNQNNLFAILTLVDQPLMRTSIRFISPAEKLTDVLSEIHFQSDSLGTAEVQITLQYGRCKHNETYLVEHEFSESTSECYITQEKIYINVRQNPQEFVLSHYPFPWFSLLVIILLGPIFYIKGKARQIAEELRAEWKEEGAIELNG